VGKIGDVGNVAAVFLAEKNVDVIVPAFATAYEQVTP